MQDVYFAIERSKRAIAHELERLEQELAQYFEPCSLLQDGGDSQQVDIKRRSIRPLTAPNLNASTFDGVSMRYAAASLVQSKSNDRVSRMRRSTEMLEGKVAGASDYQREQTCPRKVVSIYTEARLPMPPLDIDFEQQSLLPCKPHGDADSTTFGLTRCEETARLPMEQIKSPNAALDIFSEGNGIPNESVFAKFTSETTSSVSSTASSLEVEETAEARATRNWATLIEHIQEKKAQALSVVLDLRPGWVAVLGDKKKDSIEAQKGMHTLLKQAMLRGDTKWSLADQSEDEPESPKPFKESSFFHKLSRTVSVKSTNKKSINSKVKREKTDKSDVTRKRPRKSVAGGHLKAAQAEVAGRDSMTAEDLAKWHAGELVTDKDSWLQCLVYHPDKAFACARMIIGSTLIAYDLVVFPMAAFSLDDSLDLMNWVTCVWWTFDIPLSFLQGFYKRGAVEMRPRKIAMHYGKSWLLPDFILVALDCILLISSLTLLVDSPGPAEDSGGLRLLRTIRGTRIFRVIRSLRIVRVFSVITEAFESMLSEILIIIARLIFLIIAMLVVCHYTACAWYGLGAWNPLDVNRTWVIEYDLNDADTFTKYVTALHWSLTQFTPSTNNVAPTNGAERLFAVTITVFAVVMFSNFVSSITNATMQIRKINSDKYTEEQQIRNFLSVKQVPLVVSNGIWHFYKNHYTVRKSCSYEHDISFFSVIPNSLCALLHEHIYLPTLEKHRCLWCYCKSDKESLVAMCKVAVHEKYFLHGGEIFNPRDPGTYMYFGKVGTLMYDCALYRNIYRLETQNGCWVAEAALWSKWHHCGHLTANECCEMLLLDCTRFEWMMQQRAAEVGLLRCLRTYAALFAQFVSDSADLCRPITDILGEGYSRKQEKLNKIAFKAFTSSEEAQDEMIRQLQESQVANMFSRLTRAARKKRPSLTRAFGMTTSFAKKGTKDLSPSLSHQVTSRISSQASMPKDAMPMATFSGRAIRFSISETDQGKRPSFIERAVDTNFEYLT